MKQLTLSEFRSVRDGYSFNNKDSVDWEYEEIDEFFVKHDVTSYEFVFKDISTGKWYRGYYSRSYNNGIEDYCFPIDLDEVEKVEVKTWVWQPVKK